MKLNILSDLHLGFGSMDRPVNDADVGVLAGDISRPREAAAWALRLGKPVLYVLGNHEFYGSSIEGADRLLTPDDSVALLVAVPAWSLPTIRQPHDSRTRT